MHTSHISSLIHSLNLFPLVPNPRICFNYETASGHPSPLHGSLELDMTPKENPTPCNNPTNPVPNVPADPDSDPSSSDSSF